MYVVVVYTYTTRIQHRVCTKVFSRQFIHKPSGRARAQHRFARDKKDFERRIFRLSVKLKADLLELSLADAITIEDDSLRLESSFSVELYQ